MKFSDYFVMINGGCTGYQTILLNLASSITSFLAAFIVLGLKDVSHHLLLFVIVLTHLPPTHKTTKLANSTNFIIQTLFPTGYYE